MMLGVGAMLSDKDDRTDAQVEFLIALARGFRTAAKFLFPIPERGLERRLHRITAPTLVVWGEQDRFAQPSYGKIFVEKIRGARLMTIPNAGHLIGAEQPEAYGKALLTFGS
jgi:pimeloyl-ACP methyl ester carboxylesterase